MPNEEKTRLLKKKDISNGTNFGYKYFLLLLIMFFVYTSMGIVFYVISQWIQYKVKKQILQGQAINSTSVCEGTNQSDPEYRKYEHVEQKTAFWQMIYSLATPVPALFATAILPSLSDSIGRKILFVIPMTFMLLKYIMYALIIYYDQDIIWAVIACLVEGLSGAYYTYWSGVYSYIADITTPGRQRTFGVTFFEGSLLICLTLSGLAAGYFIEFSGYETPMMTCVVLQFVAWSIVIFLLPESNEKQFRGKKMPLCIHFKRISEFYRSKEFAGKRSAYILLLLAFFVAELTTMHRSSIEMLYQLGKPFCWPSQKIGLFSAARHATEGFAGVVLIAPLKTVFTEISIAILSAVFNAGSYLLEAFATTDLILYLVPIPATFSFLMIPLIKSTMSSITPADKQGSLFSSIVTVQAICTITTTYLMNTIYSATLSIFHGFVFLVLAGCSSVVLILLIIFAKTQRVDVAGPKVERIVTNS